MSDALHLDLQSALGATYTLERELGGGGMSRVFVATDRSLGRRVVIKVLSPEVAEGVKSDRFAREIRLAAGLQHPNIVPLLSAGDAAGIAYYTMPFVEGESLGVRLRQGNGVSIVDAVSLLKDVARALAFAHGKGVVHRDIKPDNVLMTGGVASVIDFGIAKALSAAREGDGGRGAPGKALTTVGVSLGTPEYMAPEQALADQTSDHRVDIYAFGCVAYEVLVGTSPFHGRPLQAMVMAHVTEAPAPVEGARPDVPRPLAALVAQCLEKDPVKRPQSADEIVELLSAMSTSTYTAQRAVPAPAVTRASMARPRRAAIGAGVVLLIAVGGYVGITKLRAAAGAGADAISSIAVLPFENVGGDTANAYFADGMADELISALGKVHSLRVASRSSSFSLRGKNMNATEIGRALRVSAVLEGTVRRTGTRIRMSAQLSSASDGLVFWSDTYEKELRDVFAVQDEVARQIVGALRVSLDSAAGGDVRQPTSAKGTDDLEAYDLYLKGLYFYQRRGAGVRTALDFYSQAVAKDPGFARAYAGVAFANVGTPVFLSVNPAPYLKKAMESAKRAVALDSTLAEAHLALAVVNQALFNWREAGAAYEQAIALDPTAEILRQYGRYLLYTGRIPEALKELERADPLDPFSAINVSFLAHGLSLAGQHQQAVAAGQRALQLDSLLVGAQAFNMRLLMDAGRDNDARALALRALRPNADIHVVAFAAFTLGRTGDRARALGLIEEIKARPGEEHRRARALATAYLGVGDTDHALKSLEAGLDAGDARPELNSFADRAFDSLRASPRFATIIRRYGLEPAVFTLPTGGRP